MDILIAILALSLMVIFHEFGHYIVARANGVRVKEFSIGLGPRLVGFTKGETDYCINILPFGGACVMQGDIDDETKDETYDEEKSFDSKSVWARMSIIFAGPFFNFLLAFIFSVIIIGYMGYSPAKIYSVEEGSVAEEAGLLPGDVIVKVNNRTISFDTEFDIYRMVYAEKTMKIKYERDGKKYTTTVIPKKVKGQAYRIGITISGSPVSIVEINEDSPADKAGIKPDDVLLKINGNEISVTDDVTKYVSEAEGKACVYTILRDGKEIEFTVTPEIVDYENYETGLVVYSPYIKGNALTTLKYSFHQVRYSIMNVIDSFHMLFAGDVTSEDVAGPVGIVNLISDTVESGKEYGIMSAIMNLLFLIVLLSANLGVMNLLPIPALDGGRLVFLLIEAVRGKPISKEKEGFVHMIGLALLMLLMVFVLFNDIKNVFFK